MPMTENGEILDSAEFPTTLSKRQSCEILIIARQSGYDTKPT